MGGESLSLPLSSFSLPFSSRHAGLLAEFGLTDLTDAHFPQAALDCLPPTPWSISLDEMARRRDLRPTRIFSIDPPTARDLDDALSCERLQPVSCCGARGGWRNAALTLAFLVAVRPECRLFSMSSFCHWQVPGPSDGAVVNPASLERWRVGVHIADV